MEDIPEKGEEDEKLPEEGEEEKYAAVAQRARPEGKFLDSLRNIDYYCIYEDDIYARNYQSNDENFSYYFIDTQIAVGSDSGKPIKRIQFELDFQSTHNTSDKIVVMSVSPLKEKRSGGTVSEKETVIIKKLGDVNGGINAGIALGVLEAKFGTSGTLKYDKSKETVSKFEYPKEVTIVEGRAADTFAIWEFNQDDVTPLRGQYNLGIFFKIRKPHGDLNKKGLFVANPRIFMNGRNVNRDENKQPISPSNVVFLK